MWLCESARQISGLAGWSVSTNASSGFSERLSQNKVGIGGASSGHWPLSTDALPPPTRYTFIQSSREREWEVGIFIELDSWTFDL